MRAGQRRLVGVALAIAALVGLATRLGRIDAYAAVAHVVSTGVAVVALQVDAAALLATGLVLALAGDAAVHGAAHAVVAVGRADAAVGDLAEAAVAVAAGALGAGIAGDAIAIGLAAALGRLAVLALALVAIIQRAGVAVVALASADAAAGLRSVLAVVLEPSKSEVVITPVELFNAQFAKDAFVNTDVVSEYVTVSPVAATVATVPEKFPATVPKEPEEVVHTGASETVKKLAADMPEFPSGFSTLIL